jgi:hypothetical protein
MITQKSNIRKIFNFLTKFENKIHLLLQLLIHYKKFFKKTNIYYHFEYQNQNLENNLVLSKIKITNKLENNIICVFHFMQATTMSLSSCFLSSNLKMQTFFVSSSPSTPKFHPFQNSHYHSFSSSPLRLTIDGFSCPSFSLFQTVRKSSPFLISNPKISSFRVSAASVPEAKSDEPTQPSELIQSLQLGFMFATWYLLNIYFNIYNKQVLFQSFVLNYEARILTLDIRHDT